MINMRKRQIRRPQIDFSCKWCGIFSAFMGGSLFFTTVRYFGLINLVDCGFGEILFLMILPMLISVAFVVLVWGMQLNAPGIYGILGMCCCALLIIGSIFTGDILRIILSILGYGAGAAALYFAVAGRIRSASMTSSVFVAALIIRILLYSFRSFNLSALAMEGAALCMIAGLSCLPLMLRSDN